MKMNNPFSIASNIEASRNKYQRNHVKANYEVSVTIGDDFQATYCTATLKEAESIFDNSNYDHARIRELARNKRHLIDSR